MRVEVTSPHAAALASLDAPTALPPLGAPIAPLPAGWKQQRRVRARSAFESRDLMGGGAEGFPGFPGQAELTAEGALRSPALAREATESGKRAQKRRNSSEWELYASGEEARGEWGRGETGGLGETGRGGKDSKSGDSSVETRRGGRAAAARAAEGAAGMVAAGGSEEAGLLVGAGRSGVVAAAGSAPAAHRRAASTVPILGGTLAVNSGGRMGSESGGFLSSSGVAGGAAEFPLWVRNSEAESYLHSAAHPVLLAESMGES
ncbi:unnamed protein product [Closterium sp. Naga37s-1]|nr:unnamed protein product [Closterium sp. Naga37s-1]